jgi:naphtho-gamma-pyrone polyketide synthase
MKKLIDSFALKARPIPIETPYHASHLYNLEDVDEIMMGCSDTSHLDDYALRMPLLSTATGQSTGRGQFIQMLRQAAEDTLCRQVRWDHSCGALRTIVSKSNAVKRYVIVPIASNAATLVCGTLHDMKDIDVSIMPNQKWSSTEGVLQSGKFQDDKIAIIGYSGRYPEARSNDELWEVLMAARDCHRTIPPDRFDWEAHYDPAGKKKNHSRVKYGCFINEPGLFDARYFNMSPKEAENTDPAQRLAIMAAYEAMEMAGMVPDRTASTQRDRVGVFFGTTSDDWREVNSGQVQSSTLGCVAYTDML